MKILSALLLVILALMLCLSIYFLYQNLPLETREFEEFSQEAQVPNASTSSLFYPNLRFRDKRISYQIESVCTNAKAQEVREALSILEQKTPLEFYPSSNGEIAILCSQIPPEPEQEGKKRHFVAGEGGPTEIIDATLFSVIFSGKIAFYRNETCETPNIALHEMLHVLGFDHNSNPKSILYPLTSCKQELDSYITEELNRLYQIPSLPDLVIEKASALKSGKYLNFNVTISNYGLKDSPNASLSILTENKAVKDFSLGLIELGTKKALAVQNLEIPASTAKVTFVVDKADKIQEISKDNNKAELVIK